MSAVSAVFHLDGSPIDTAAMERMVAFQRAQGPDGEATWANGPAGLGHNLFRATFESERETQPLSLDGGVRIVADAFLVGREELVDALRAKGRPATLRQPDAELILHAYRAWGTDCTQHLLGYFAFVVWDPVRQQVFAARDHFGNRTLYCGQKGACLVLATSVDAIARHPAVGSDLSEFHIGSFLALGSVRFIDPSGTPFQNIRTLRPAEQLVATFHSGVASGHSRVASGHSRVASGHSREGGNPVTITRYWECPADVPLMRYRREEEVIERYKEIFARAIRDRLRSSRVAITVSGGMDSTSVLAMTAKVIRERGNGPEIVGFCQDHRVINRTREAELASKLCRQLDVPLALMVMDEVPWLAKGYSPVTLAFYALANQQQDYIRRLASLAPAVLFGSSGDMQRTATLSHAMTGDHPWRALSGFARAWRRHGIRPEVNLGIQRALIRMGWPKGDYARHFPEWLRPDIERRHGFRRTYERGSLPPLADGVARNTRHPWLQYWSHRRDIGSVYHGNAADSALEGLDPLGDKRLLDFFLALPPLPWLANKYLQREAMRGLLPDEIRLRPRQAVRSHHAPFLQDRSNTWIDDWQPDSRLEPFLQRNEVPRLVRTPVPPHQAITHLRAWVCNQWLTQR